MPVDDALVIGPEGLPRCPWPGDDPEYLAYHDEEWGRPVRDEQALFEKLCLEAFQAGLSWLTILRKREGFRRAFRGFDPDAVAAFDSDDVAGLLGDEAIVRNRAKIDATVANARALLELHRSDTTLSGLIWGHAPADRGDPPRHLSDVPATTPESSRLSKALKAQGFRFVGPTSCYALMQAMGVVNDHLVGCWAREQIESVEPPAAPRQHGPRRADATGRG